MIITKLVLGNFRGLRRLEVEPASRRTFIVAMNGVGKTSIIEALAAALGGLVRGSLDEPSKALFKGLIYERDHRREWPGLGLPMVTEKVLTVHATAQWDDLVFSWKLRSQRSIRDGTHVNEVRLEWDPGDRKKLVDKLDAVTRRGELLPLVAVLPAQRAALGEKTELPRITADDSVSAERLLRWAAKPQLEVQWYPLRNRWFELEQRRKYAGERAESACKSVEEALKRALGLIQAPVFDADSNDFLIDIPGEGWRAVNLMSDGWRAYVGSVVAVALRCAEINPAEQDAGLITPGVLLIDELEQHLHPKLQLEIVDGLQAAFPELQVIATTHSSLVLTDITANDFDRVLRIDRGSDGAIGITPLDAPAGRNAVQVLTGEWFGLPSTLDDDTLRKLAIHRGLLRKGAEAKAERKVLEDQLRLRIGRYAETSVEEFVLSVVAELEDDSRFARLSHGEMVALREDVIARIKAELPS